MAEKRKFILDNDAFRIILIVLGSIFSTAVISFSIVAVMEIHNGNLEVASRYLLGIFIVLGLSRLITFFREKTKISFLRFIVLLIFDIVLGIIILFGRTNHYMYSLAGGLYCLTIILSRIFKIFQKPQLRNIIFSSIIILFSILLSIGLFIPTTISQIDDVVLIVCAIAAITAFIEVFSNAMSSLRLKVLFKIILRTYALEILLGLFTMMVASALIYMLYEDAIPTFADGLWFAFTVVTTIGFGDYAIVTPIGRIMTVVLGIYGVFIVAVLTSIIVNFYNETAGKKDAKEFKEINNEENDKK